MGKSIIDEINAMEQKISQYESRLKDYNKIVETIVKNEFGMTVKELHKLIEKNQKYDAKKAESVTQNQATQRPMTPQRVLSNTANSGAQMQGKKQPILERK